MAADTELIKVDYIEKETWDALLNGGGGSGLPDVTSADNGKLLGVSSGKWQKVDPPAAGGGTFEVAGTVDTSGEHATITIDKTAAEAYAAIAAGKLIKCAVTLGETQAQELILPVVAAKTTNDGTNFYAFRFVDASGNAYSAASLTGTDTLVFTGE